MRDFGRFGVCILAVVRHCTKGKPVEVVGRSTARRRAALSTALGAALGALTMWAALPLIEAPRIPAIAVVPQLFKVGEYLCWKNEGLRRVEIVMPVNDRYTFVCGNGARFEDTFARIK